MKRVYKKTGYWIIIFVSFLIAKLFISLGKEIVRIELEFLALVGRFILVALLVNKN